MYSFFLNPSLSQYCHSRTWTLLDIVYNIIHMCIILGVPKPPFLGFRAWDISSKLKNCMHFHYLKSKLTNSNRLKKYKTFSKIHAYLPLILGVIGIILGVPGIILGVPNRYNIRGTRYNIRGTGCNIRGTGCNIRGTRYDIRGTGCNIRGIR